MARQLRVEYEGAIYHVMSRGDRREEIFRDDRDREIFLRALGETCEKAGWQVHAYCLMGNHFHLVIETPQPTLVRGMKWFLGTYTQRFNARHQERGHLFAGRYKSLLVDERDDLYLRVVCDYVHLNPFRAGLLEEGAALESYPWSSYAHYLEEPKKRPKWLRVDRYLGEYGVTCDDDLGRQQLAIYLEQRCAGDTEHAEDILWKDIRRGWKFGADDFVERLAEIVARGSEKVQKGNLLSDAVRESEEVRAENIIQAHAGKLGTTIAVIRSWPKTHPEKITIALELRKKTTLSVSWIAETLNAGKAATLWNQMRHRKREFQNERD